jgi:trimeric autotransporter adhesin
MKTITDTIYAAFALFTFACFALLQNAQAVVPPPDGGYANQNTAEGKDALFSLTIGTDNTAIGFDALHSNTEGSGNTATGSLALLSNTGFQNTANGAFALRSNAEGNNNTANGFAALDSNTTGGDNTATGFLALFSNTTGGGNTANGSVALESNTAGSNNNAFGVGALAGNEAGNANVAVGSSALQNASGDSNTAVGNAGLSLSGRVNNNTALGRRALYRTQGDQNTGLGFFSGSNLSDGGTNNIYISNVGPVPIGTESNTIRIGTQTATVATIPDIESHPMPAHTATFIAGIFGKTSSSGTPVYINSNGKLGTTTSSKRFKENIKPMDKASEAILALQPVSFRYKKELDPDGIPQFGLVAEQVEKVNPDLVVRDSDGKVNTVRYEAVNAMLLNEFLKEHRKVEEQSRKIQEQDATITQFKKEMQTIAARLKEQDSKIQKVSARLEMQKPSAQTVANNQ